MALLLLSNLFCFFQQQKNIPKVTIYNVFKAGSACKKQQDPYPHWEMQLDLDPQKNECGSTALFGVYCTSILYSDSKPGHYTNMTAVSVT